MMLLVSFVAFFAMVVAWLVAPSAPMEKTPATTETVTGTFVAAESAV